MDQEFFNACEAEFYAQSPIPQALPVGKLWGVVSGLMKKGMNPLVILNLVQWIMGLISTFSASSIEEIIAKVLEYLNPKA